MIGEQIILPMVIFRKHNSIWLQIYFIIISEIKFIMKYPLSTQFPFIAHTAHKMYSSNLYRKKDKHSGTSKKSPTGNSSSLSNSGPSSQSKITTANNSHYDFQQG